MSDTATPQQPTDDQRKQALANAAAAKLGIQVSLSESA